MRAQESEADLSSIDGSGPDEEAEEVRQSLSYTVSRAG